MLNVNLVQGSALNNKDALDYVFNSGDTLDPNVSITSIAKSIPEATSLVSLLGLRVIGTSSLLTRKAIQVSFLLTMGICQESSASALSFIGEMLQNTTALH
jgi:hypothetical protein